MRWADIADGEWTIPKEPREKDNAGSLALPSRRSRSSTRSRSSADNPYVFAADAATTLSTVFQIKAPIRCGVRQKGKPVR